MFEGVIVPLKGTSFLSFLHSIFFNPNCEEHYFYAEETKIILVLIQLAIQIIGDNTRSIQANR